MRTFAAIVVAACAFAAGGGAAPAAAAPAGDEAGSGDLVADATRLRDEAKALFKTAGDPDAEHSERSKARKECFKKLKSARKLLDQHLASNPGSAEALDPLYCDISTMMFWVKKELTLEEIKELQGGAPTVPPSASGGGGKPADAGGAGGSGIGGAGPRDGGGGGGNSGGGTSGGGTGGGAQQPPQTPPAPTGPTPADGLAEVEAYGREHPGDVPGLYERYAEFLEKFPDPATPEYAKAAATLKQLDDRLKGVYRLARDEDPDSVRSEDPAETQKRLKQLLADLAANDEAVRTRAAKFLGYLGSPEAVPPLLDVVRSASEGGFRDAACQALADLGGRRTYDRLLKAAQKDPSLNGLVVDVLRRALQKGGPNGRLAGETLARFADALPLSDQAAVIASLGEAGPAGGLGLAYAAAAYAPDEQRAELVEKVGALKDPRTVTYLARFLFQSPKGRRLEQASAAREAIETIGRPGVRYLIPALDEPAVQLWTAELLRQITGAKQKDDKRKTWEAWFRKNRRSFE